jgi:hypothetical protein
VKLSTELKGNVRHLQLQACLIVYLIIHLPGLRHHWYQFRVNGEVRGSPEWGGVQVRGHPHSVGHQGTPAETRRRSTRVFVVGLGWVEDERPTLQVSPGCVLGTTVSQEINTQVG